MPARMVEIKRAECTCHAEVSHEVFDAFGNSRGRWCRKCAAELVATLNGGSRRAAVEDDETQAERPTPSSGEKKTPQSAADRKKEARRAYREKRRAMKEKK